MRPDRPVFALDQNFPEPILREAPKLWIPEVELKPLREVDRRLVRAHEDWQVLLALHQMGLEGLITCDANMIWIPETMAIVEVTGMSVVACEEAGHDPLVASGLLLIHLPWVAKRHEKGIPEIWRLRAVESRPLKLAAHSMEVERRSGLRIADFWLGPDMLRTPILPQDR